MLFRQKCPKRPRVGGVGVDYDVLINTELDKGGRVLNNR